MKHLLRVLESHARDGGSCYLKEGTIAQEMGVTDRTVRTAIADCVARGLLLMDRSFYRGSASRYEIEWSEIAQAILDQPETASLIEQKRRETPEKSVSLTQETFAGTPESFSLTPEDSAVTPEKIADRTANCTSTRARAVLNHVLNHERKPLLKPCTDDTANRSTRQQSRIEPHTDASTPTGGWPHPLSISDFQNRERIQSLWEHALKFRFVTSSDRIRFFALAKYVQRMTVRERKINDPGAYFTSQLIAKKWLGDHEDVRAAIGATTTLDGALDRVTYRNKPS